MDLLLIDKENRQKLQITGFGRESYKTPVRISDKLNF